MDTKHIHCMLEDMAEYGKEMISCATGSGNVNLDDAGKIIDIVKDLAEAEYHALIAKEMRKAHEEEEAEEKYILRMLKEEHGMSEEDSRRFYDAWRYKSSGRFAPRGKGERYGRRGYEEPPYMHIPEDYRMDLADYKGKTAEEMRDMDRHTKGVMYYTEPVRMDGMKHEESRYEKAKRGYQETKAMHKGNTPEDKQLTMREAEKMLNVVFDEIDEMLEDATPEMKNMVKTKGMTRFQKIS